MTREQLKSVLEGPLAQILDKLNCLVQNAGGNNPLESDAQLICVAGNPPTQLLQWVVKLNGIPNGTVIYTDLSGNTVAAPGAGTFTFGECSTSAAQVFKRCLCDDVNGDGSLIVNYVQFYQYDPGSNSITVTGNWNEDLTALYVPVNATDCNAIGAPQQIVQRRQDLTGVTAWVRPINVQSLTIKVRRVGDVLNPPTITDNNGTTTPLFIGDVETWSVLDTEALLLQGAFTITLNNVNDHITIIYTELL